MWTSSVPSIVYLMINHAKGIFVIPASGNIKVSEATMALGQFG